MEAAAVRARRVARNHLTERTTAPLADVVRDVCGVQAQVQGAADLALATRVDGITRADVRAALWERRELVRVWAMRGTVHLLPAAELPLWMAALSVTPYWEEPAWCEARGLTVRQVAAVLDAIGAALAGRALLRAELADEVVARAGANVRDALMSGWGTLIAPATRLGLLCHGPPRGTHATFVRADEWVGGWRDHDPRAALAEVFRRFLATYGPAKATDFERWSGVDLPADVAARVDTAEVLVGRRRCLVLAGDSDADAPPPPVRLLSKYDCYVLGSYPRETAVPKEHLPRLRAHPRGRYESAAGHYPLLVDGLVAGIWERRDDGIRVEPFVDLSAADAAALEAEVARVAAFHGVPPSLSLGPLL